MTLTEYKSHPLGKGDTVKTFDNGSDGYPKKWVEGIVTGTSEEGFDVLWDDFKHLGWETEYEWSKVEIKGNEIIQ